MLNYNTSTKAVLHETAGETVAEKISSIENKVPGHAV